MQTMPRRANLTGKLRKDGRWEVRVTLTRIDGAKVVKPLYGKTLLEAQEKAHRLIYDSGRSVPDSFTINELADAWEASFKDSVLKPATLKSYRLMLKGIRQLFGAKEASGLDVPTVVNGLKRIKAPRMRTATRTVLGTMLSYGRLTEEDYDGTVIVNLCRECEEENNRVKRLDDEMTILARELAEVF